MIKLIQKATASSKEGAIGLIKALSPALFKTSHLCSPAGILVLHSRRFAKRRRPERQNGVFYVAGCAVCFALIFITTWFQYNNTFFTTYEESGKRRISLAETLRKLPLSFFRQKGPC